MFDLIIVAAGRGSRLSGSGVGNQPKALVPIIDGESSVERTTRFAKNYDSIFVVTNHLHQKDWAPFFIKFPQATNIPISSGLGDGHAVLEAGKYCWKHDLKLSEKTVVCWGDVFFKTERLLEEMRLTNFKNAIIPARRENNPYVTLLVDDELDCTGADFSKYGEMHNSGFHDQSVFGFNSVLMYDSLQHLHNALWKNGQYMTHGGELSLLHTFHYLYNTGSPAKVYETENYTATFNTFEELVNIQNSVYL